jgi:hypothetical protein
MGTSLSKLFKRTKKFLWKNRFYIGTGVIAIGVYYFINSKYENVSCTRFLKELNQEEVSKVIISGGILRFQTNGGQWYITNRSLISNEELCKMLR